MSSSATASSCASVTLLKSVPLGKYWRSSPLVFSLEPRCQGACGSQKKTSMPASTEKDHHDHTLVMPTSTPGIAQPGGISSLTSA